jgi:hypothetical protein
MKASIFHSGDSEEIAEAIKQYLRKNNNHVSSRSLNSPRAVGDALQEIVAENFQKLTKNVCVDFSANFARRAMADFAFHDHGGNHYVVDVKTHREDTKFNMPNLTSVERLARFYEEDKNYFCLLLIKYKINNEQLDVTEVAFVPIEKLDWKCLTIGALGWGQIQIANSNKIVLNRTISRKKWMIRLCEVMMEFYPREAKKIAKRLARFKSEMEKWIVR